MAAIGVVAIASPGQAASSLERLQYTGRRKGHVREPFARERVEGVGDPCRDERVADFTKPGGGQVTGDELDMDLLRCLRHSQ